MTTLLVLFVLYAVGLSVALGRAGVRSPPTRRTAGSGAAPASVLVVGATGGTGRHLVTQALERGYRVTAFVRDPSRLGIDHPRLEVARGDVLDPASVQAAMRGQDAVLCALGHSRYFGPTRILSEGTHNLLRAMEEHGATRLVCETSLGIGDSAGRMGLYYTLFVIPVVLPFYFWDKTRQERAIAGSGLEWVIVRPGVLTDGEGRGTCRHGSDVGSYLWTVRVRRADVAAFMLDQLAPDAAYVGRAPGVASARRSPSGSAGPT
ncbi:MAG TPA: SDR family oxidoreductase [Longimicrobiales bacterium]|nr:SDR family oxidoreductase [Longimicrobiales bacterium]